MSEPLANRPDTLAGLIDSRQDLRELLTTNFNLAHAVLLLRRGERETVERALELALANGGSEIAVAAECIRIELLRTSGSLHEAVHRAEALAQKERFNTLAVLYFRQLFPSMEQTPPSAPAAAPALPVDAPAHAEELALGGDSPSVPAENSVVADPPIDEVPADPEESDLPPKWRTIGKDPAVEFLRIIDGGASHEVRRGEIAVGVLEDTTFGLAGRILERLSFGPLKHGSFEGANKVIHSWKRDDLRVSAVIQSGSSASLLAARCTRAFEDHA
jgi:hypothetical protein